LDIGAVNRAYFSAKNNLSPSEMVELKFLEVPKLSYGAELSYMFKEKKNIQFRIGIAFKRLRFGTRIYKLPPGSSNNTPQYNKRKKAVALNQLILFPELIFNEVQLLGSSGLFVNLCLVLNNKYYKIYNVTYDNKGKRGF